MDCECGDTSDFDMPTFSKCTSPVARKEHTCCECKKIIRKGEDYERKEGVWDGSWRIYKTCEICADIANVFFCGGYPFGDLYWDLDTCLKQYGDDLPYKMIDRLSDRARDRILGLIDEIWEE